MQSYNPAILGVQFLKIIWMVANHVNKKNAGKPRLRSIAALAATCSVVAFYVKPPSAKVNFARIWCISSPTPTSLGFLTLKRWHGKIWPQLRGLPGVADRATLLEGWPHLSSKRDQIKMRHYMDRRVTPPKWVTIPTWGPLPPCKQTLKVSPAPFLQFKQLNYSPFNIWVNLVPLESHSTLYNDT